MPSVVVMSLLVSVCPHEEPRISVWLPATVSVLNGPNSDTALPLVLKMYTMLCMPDELTL